MKNRVLYAILALFGVAFVASNLSLRSDVDDLMRGHSKFGTNVLHSTTNITGGHTNATTLAAGFMSTSDKIKLDGIGTADVSLGGFGLTNLRDPVAAQEAVTKNFYDVNRHTIRSRVSLQEDWLVGAVAGSTNWLQNVATGTVTIPTTGLSSTRIGLVQLSTGAGTAANAGISQNGSSVIQFGSAGDVSIEWEFQIPTLPTVGSQDAIIRCGAGDVYNGSDINNGVVVEINLANDSHYVLETAGSSTQERHATTVAVDTGFHRFRETKPEGSTHWGLKIDGTDTGVASTTNEPGSANVGFTCMIKKSSGSAPITVLIDWFDFYESWSTPRNN